MIYFRNEDHKVCCVERQSSEIINTFGYENAIQIFEINYKVRALNNDGTFIGASDIIKAVRIASSEILYLDKYGELHITVRFTWNHKKVIGNVVDYWVNRNLLLVKRKKGQFRLYEFKKNNLFRFYTKIEKCRGDILGFRLLSGGIRFLYKQFDQEIHFASRHVYVDNLGRLCADGKEYDTPSPVKYLRESNGELLIFLEDGSLYNEDGKITDSLCFPLDHTVSSKAKSARKIQN